MIYILIFLIIIISIYKLYQKLLYNRFRRETIENFINKANKFSSTNKEKMCFKIINLNLEPKYGHMIYCEILDLSEKYNLKFYGAMTLSFIVGYTNYTIYFENNNKG